MKGSMKITLTSRALFGFLFVLAALVGTPIAIFQLQQQQEIRQRADTGIAWSTSQSASSSCPTTGSGAIITATFNNTEPDRSNYAMNVVAKDRQTGKSVNLGSIRGGQSKSGVIQTGRTSLSAGTVDFALTWTDGHSGIDSRSAGYQTISNCNTPTPTPPQSEPVCPAGTDQVDVITGGPLLANGTPSSKTHTLTLDNAAKLIFSGFLKEGHPEDCPNGPSCNQGQLYEEITLSVNGTKIGESTDTGGPVDAWVPIGPWETSSTINKGSVSVVINHRKRSTKGPESVDYKLAVCAQKPQSTPVPSASPTPTKPNDPTPTVCPTLAPVKNVRIDCPNCP